MSEALSHSFSHPPRRSKSSMSSIMDKSRSPSRKNNSSIRSNQENAYNSTPHNYNNSFQKNNYSFSVQDIVRSRSKKNLDFGIEGY